MWTPATREQHSRDGLRYSTDLTDTEWDVIVPLLPAACQRAGLTIWQQVDDIVALEVYQDDAVTVTAHSRPVVYGEDARRQG